MADKVHKNDFIEIDFVARIKGSNKIFDLTREDIAKKEQILQEGRKYEPLIVCLGTGHLLKGLDQALEGREIGEELEIEVQPEDGFGKRNPKLIQLTTLKQFKDKGITPVPGLQFSIDGALATIRSVSGGRVIIDFNHPLSGKVLLYSVKINRKVTDTKQKIESIIFLLANLEKEDYTISISEKEISVEFKKEVPKPIIDLIKKQIIKLIPEAAQKELKIEVKKK